MPSRGTPNLPLRTSCPSRCSPTPAAAYGSLTDLGFIRFARRNTFIIDPQGRIARVYTGVNAARNAEDIAAELRRLTTP